MAVDLRIGSRPISLPDLQSGLDPEHIRDAVSEVVETASETFDAVSERLEGLGEDARIMLGLRQRPRSGPRRPAVAAVVLGGLAIGVIVALILRSSDIRRALGRVPGRIRRGAGLPARSSGPRQMDEAIAVWEDEGGARPDVVADAASEARGDRPMHAGERPLVAVPIVADAIDGAEAIEEEPADDIESGGLPRSESDARSEVAGQAGG
jgi:hypothetical protein